MQRPFLITADARQDLVGCATSTIESLFDVIEYGLSIPPDFRDPDEGGKPPPCYYWRRGITKEHRAKLDEALGNGHDDDYGAGTGEHPWDFVIVFRRASPGECITRRWRLRDEPVVVVRFLRSSQIGAEILVRLLEQ
ncbi:hypothetical protein [Streptomyces sp. URMC 123]|uniref:hypothetical protein n=1 Tax=Streptomyces sp. URMC 123 TaxID=3423403 RepID=UPI003F1974C0